jgi:hypothetical protein
MSYRTPFEFKIFVSLAFQDQKISSYSTGQFHLDSDKDKMSKSVIFLYNTFERILENYYMVFKAAHKNH